MPVEKIKMKNVRISFPNLFTTSFFGGEDTGKYDATFILDKKEHADMIKTIKSQIQQLADEKFKGKIPSEDRICLKDGDATDRDEQQGAYTLKASTKRRPLVIDRDKSPLTEADNKIYAGCYVNGIVSMWAQDNAYGKRINCSLEGVQFCAHGDPLGTPAVTPDEFDAFGEADDDREEMAF